MPIWPGTQQMLYWQIRDAVHGQPFDPPVVAIIVTPPAPLPTMRADSRTTPLSVVREQAGLWKYLALIPLQADGDWHVRWEAYDVDSNGAQLRDANGALAFIASEELTFTVQPSTVHRA